MTYMPKQAIGDQVKVCNYSSIPQWLPAKVTSILGPVSYQVSLNDGRSWRRHQDQLLKTAHTSDTTSELDTDFDFCTSDGRSDSTTSTPQAVDNNATEQPSCRRSSRVRRPPDRLTF